MTRRSILAALAVALGMTLGGGVARAQKVKYKKTTQYNFQDDTISGDLTRPDGEYVQARRKVRHSNLIRIRKNFRHKILQSVGEL